MTNSQVFPFVVGRDAFGDTDAVPRLPLILQHQNLAIEVAGLVDSGASVNVLPYSIGNQLGLNWEQPLPSVRLGGNLAPVEAKPVRLIARVGDFSPVELAFAWAYTDDMPLILGRMNFFLAFDVYFYRSRMLFEIRPSY